ncbi:DUF4258 domain-containing protein [Patescibacteria group bacterium]|nr:DUF4258 domain-containing protein [Patescibacteria group bacterium]
MHYHLTRHAQERMNERVISISELELALANPDHICYDDEGKVEIKKYL